MQEYVTVAVSADVLTLQTSTAMATIPRDKLGRSPILQQAVEYCDTGRPMELKVPVGFAAAWWQLLEDEWLCDTSAKPSFYSSKLLLHVKVCIPNIRVSGPDTSSLVL